jgi:hypothetical protein
MKHEFSELPAWTFVVDQFSEQIYYVIGKDQTGHQVSAEGVDLEQIMQQCKNYASYVDHSQSH